MHNESPSQVPSTFKKQLLNVNKPPSEHGSQGGRGGRGSGSRGFIHRGSIGFRGRGSGQAYQLDVTRPGSPNTAGRAGHMPTGTTNSPLKSRGMLWDI